MDEQYEFIRYVASQVLSLHKLSNKDGNLLIEAMLKANVQALEFPTHEIKVETERGLMVVRPHEFLAGYRFLYLKYEQSHTHLLPDRRHWGKENVYPSDMMERKFPSRKIEETKVNGLELNFAVVDEARFVSVCCIGETCTVCGIPATNKLEETIFHDDPHKLRHPLTAYVCKEHFRMIVGRLG